MLYEKPKQADLAAHVTYGHLREAVQEAAYQFGGPQVPTRQVYWTVYDYHGGGRRYGTQPEDKPISRRKDRADAAKLVRQLKKAADANVLDGQWTKSGYLWSLPQTYYGYSRNVITTNTFTTPVTYGVITGGTW
jgi:hypothetical protein